MRLLIRHGHGRIQYGAQPFDAVEELFRGLQGRHRPGWDSANRFRSAAFAGARRDQEMDLIQLDFVWQRDGLAGGNSGGHDGVGLAREPAQ